MQPSRIGRRVIQSQRIQQWHWGTCRGRACRKDHAHQGKGAPCGPAHAGNPIHPLPGGFHVGLQQLSSLFRRKKFVVGHHAHLQHAGVVVVGQGEVALADQRREKWALPWSAHPDHWLTYRTGFFFFVVVILIKDINCIPGHCYQTINKLSTSSKARSHQPPSRFQRGQTTKELGNPVQWQGRERQEGS